MTETEKINKERSNLLRLSEEDFKSANTNFSEVLKSIMLMVTAIFTLIGFYFQNNSNYTDYQGDLAEWIIYSLCASLILGIIQFYIDYQHAKNWGFFRQQLANGVAEGKIKNIVKLRERQKEKYTKMNGESQTILAKLQIITAIYGITLTAMFINNLIQ